MLYIFFLSFMFENKKNCYSRRVVVLRGYIQYDLSAYRLYANSSVKHLTSRITVRCLKTVYRAVLFFIIRNSRIVIITGKY